MRRYLTAVAAAAVLTLALPAFGEEAPRSDPSLRDRMTKIVRVIKKIFVPTPQEDYPQPPRP